MASGSGSDSVEKGGSLRGRGSKLGSMLPKIEPFVPKRDHSPRELRSWAKRTGFVSYLSGETGTASSTQRFDTSTGFERGGRDQRPDASSPKIEIDPILGRPRPNRGMEIETDTGSGSMSGSVQGRRTVVGENGNGLVEKVEERKTGLNGNVNVVENRNGNGNGVPGVAPLVGEQKNGEVKGERDVEVGMFPGGEEQDHGGWSGHHQGMKVGLRENPGFGQFSIFFLLFFIHFFYVHY